MCEFCEDSRKVKITKKGNQECHSWIEKRDDVIYLHTITTPSAPGHPSGSTIEIIYCPLCGKLLITKCE